ncbi:transposase IS3/IS911 family protein [Candidatus Protofrankia datiscae]|uniref:Transposase IS3/IS911 family protein n=1 Tax=Candidatus Protofrankia datiscae TaxID=2716812 RepID=F8B0X6_9ACTN|nr:transposase IS3/IS911 family protein [Candidatus Protofrankia datiscae]
MPRSEPPYTAEFRRQMIELVRAGRSPEEPVAEYGPSGQSIRDRVHQDERADGIRSDGLAAAERDEPNRLQKENRQLWEEREILRKAAVFSRHGDLSEMKVALTDAEKTLFCLHIGLRAGYVARGLMRVAGAEQRETVTLRSAGAQGCDSPEPSDLKSRVLQMARHSRAPDGNDPTKRCHY